MSHRRREFPVLASRLVFRIGVGLGGLRGDVRVQQPGQLPLNSHRRRFGLHRGSHGTLAKHPGQADLRAVREAEGRPYEINLDLPHEETIVGCTHASSVNYNATVKIALLFDGKDRGVPVLIAVTAASAP